MNYEASFGILSIFFLWVLIATFWWLQRIKTLENQIQSDPDPKIKNIRKDY
tara:strand:- start:441 stop:593 length:153 start_codon:yes stop_codon:yes gene_type:complete